MQGMYSTRSPAVKRLMKEAQELSEATEQYYAQPLEDNLFEWHFTIRGPSDTDFGGGIYHGRIVLPPDYPMKPPSIILLTPNGRFETNKKICLSISGHHPESWQPSWSIRTALLAIIGFMPTHGAGAIGSLDYSAEERKKLANRSKEWKCSTCGNINCILKQMTEETEESKRTSQEAKELASQINFQAEKKPGEGKSESNGETTTSQPNEQQQPIPQMPANATNPLFSSGYPFPSPFMCMPNIPPFQMPQGMDGSVNVPRFPLPPPFIPGMIPPGQQNSSQNVFLQQWQMNPFMMGRPPVPPSMVFPGQMSSSIPTQQAMNLPSQAIPNDICAGQPQAPQGKPQANSQSVKSQMPIAATTTQTSSQSAANKNSSSSPENKVSNDRDTSVEASSQGSENSTQEPQSSSSEANSNPESTPLLPQEASSEALGTTGQRSDEGLRQRLVEDTPRQTVPAGRVGQSAELTEHQHRQSGLSISTVIIFIIGLAIAILLIRRFFLSRNWRFYYGV
ncbi:uncharacterized protein LOC133186026 [Saccostrea echinata]|uniref:uncharacterized protein LOC133186026 n=1 Tax=Saccostrea echinata TaxID=191078 RepID=UPI002A82BC7D|nr:uncharacterized protein LOC133186026 [Saccostrea echinata]